MSSEPFSLDDAEAVFGPDDTEHVDASVRNAPRFSPEQIERGLALFASARTRRPAEDAADAA